MSSFAVLVIRRLRQMPRKWIFVAFGAWLAIVSAGMCRLASYTNQAGVRVTAPPPTMEVITANSPGKYRLFMFAHPHCPCTAASVAELARLLAGCADKVDATVYFFRAESQSDNWVKGQLWNSAAVIPGVRTEIDPQGRAAEQFGSTTSGEVLLYDSRGSLRFHGGITSGRGHEGDNCGKSAVISIVQGDQENADHSPVFGCAIRPASLAVSN